MSKSHSEKLQHYHNKGEQDYQKSDYNPPRLTHIVDSQKHIEEREAYNEGWSNARKQDPDATSGCFLSTACVEGKGLTDDCVELMVLRHFRDTYLAKRPNGNEEVCFYYEIAPKIVQAIHKMPDADDRFSKLYDELVKPCVALIATGRYADAYMHYKNMFKLLEQLYLEETL